MGKRLVFLFFSILFFHTVLARADELDTQPVVLKAIKKIDHSDTSGPKFVVGREQISMAGVATLSQALQNLGGVQLQDSVGNGQAAINMRGFGSNATSNTLFLVNGIPITNPDLAPPDLNVIPLHAIEWIEIVAGSESILYGDQAVGGVINIVTRNKAQEKAELSVSLGSYRERNGYAAIFNHYKNLNYHVSLGGSHTDNYRDHNDFNQTFLLGGFNYLYPSGRILFDMTIGNEAMEYPGALTAAQVRENRRQANNDRDFFKNWHGLFHFKHQHFLLDHWMLETNIARREMHGQGVLFSPFNQGRLIYFIKPQIKGTFYDTQVIAGLDAEQDNYRLSSIFGVNEDNQQKYGLFGLTVVPIYSTMRLSLGARGAQQNSTLKSISENSNVNRAVATLIGLAADWSVFNFYLRRAESFRFPKADENAATASGINDLRTQRGVSYESGARITAKHYQANLGIYQLNLRDEIAFDPTQTPLNPFGSNRNLSPTVRQGMTLSGKAYLHNKLALDGQYNYVHARFKNGMNAGNRIPLVAESIIRAGADYEVIENWHIYSEGIFTGNQFPANDYANQAGKIGGFTIFNFNTRYHFKNLEIGFHCNNIFNKYYYFYTVYQTSLAQEFFYPAPTRNFTLIINYLFN